MTVLEADGYYFPPGFDDRTIRYTVATVARNGIELRLTVPELSRGIIADLADYLKKNRESYLKRVAVAHIIEVLDEASRRWMTPDYGPRRMALKTIPVVTGFSMETVAESIDIEMESSQAEDMWKALRSEIIDPLSLDGFQYSTELNGHRRAYGPELIVSFFSENIPALPHLLFMRAALIKSACLGKMASGEPTFAPLYLKTIEDIDPKMAKSMAVLYWQGGDEGIENAAFHQADALILFGGLKACNALLERVPRRIPVLVHGHKMGLGVIGKKKMTRATVTDLAAAVAYDVAMFDQQACLAPHCYYIEEGGEVSAIEFSKVLAEALADMNQKMPRGALSTGEAAAINQLRGQYEMRELKGEAVALFTSPGGTDWTVVCEKDPFLFKPSPLNRFIRIISVHDIHQILPTLKPLGPFLQNAAVAIGDDREADFIEQLGQCGLTRITAPGKMAVPSMMWRHDGISPLSALLRWCDIEKKGAM
ncbi:MAG: acyl-CoA reductase [Desulfobacterales bacterium]|jgi:hypothetical protein|nr:acyl-CoA reductase [Desulfobacterales bacterium]